jgi:hypothetical protein
MTLQMVYTLTVKIVGQSYLSSIVKINLGVGGGLGHTKDVQIQNIVVSIGTVEEVLSFI